MACLSFLRDHGHPVEAVLSEVEILPCFKLHFLALVIIKWQLFYFETVLVIYLVSHAAHASRVNQLALRLIAWLTVIVVREGYLRMTLVRRYLVAVHGVHVLRILIVDVLLLPLPRLDESRALDLRLLPRTRPPACNALPISSITHPVVASATWVRVEVVTCTRQRRQDV